MTTRSHPSFVSRHLDFVYAFRHDKRLMFHLMVMERASYLFCVDKTLAAVVSVVNQLLETPTLFHSLRHANIS